MVTNDDTVVVITVDQARRINETFEDKRYYSSLSDSLESKCRELEEKLINDSTSIALQKIQIKDVQKIAENNKITAGLYKDGFETANKQLARSKSISSLKSWALAGSIILNVISYFVIFH